VTEIAIRILQGNAVTFQQVDWFWSSLRGEFRHYQHVRPNRGRTKTGPHRPENVGQ